jgi:DNA-binding response OmpR family regulator
MLGREGFTVDGYTDANAMLSHFKPRTYDLVILDCLLPTINGLHLYYNLLKIDESVNAVLLTGSPRIQEM